MEQNITARDYFHTDPEADRYYDIFFAMCRKYKIQWPDASEKDKAFITEVTRVTYERDLALRSGAAPDSIRPAFAS